MVTRSTGGSIYVLTPDIPFAVGGVRQHYKLVDTLREAGFPAMIVHREPGFRCRWFDNDTPIVVAAQTTVNERDVVVIPEEMIGLVPAMAVGVPKIIFNQNAYTTFVWGPTVDEIASAYRHPDVLATVLVSDDNLTYMRRALPDVRLHRLRLSIDTRLYHPGDARRRAVAYMPRKRKIECDELLAVLHVTGALDGWEQLPIEGLSEKETAARLRASSVFLSFSHREGFGLPPAEAMACGCVVIGFDGFAGREFMRDHAITVPDGDMQAYAQTVSDVLRSWDAQQLRYTAMARDAARAVTKTYSLDAYRQSVVPLFTEALAAPRTRAGRGRLDVLPFRESRAVRARRRVHHAAHAAGRGFFREARQHLSAACSLIVRGSE